MLSRPSDALWLVSLLKACRWRAGVRRAIPSRTARAVDDRDAAGERSCGFGAVGYVHHTRLRYETRADATFGYKRGWRTAQTLRLTGVDVTSQTFLVTGARELVRRYNLAYEPGYHVSLLKSVQMEGRCSPTNPVEDGSGALPSVTGCPTLPAMTFGYQHVAPFTTSGAPGTPDLAGYEGFDERVLSMTNSPAYSLDEELTDLYDVNADGLADVMVTAPAYFGGQHGVFFNGQGGVQSAFGAVSQLGVTGEPGLAGADTTTITLKNLNVTLGDVDSNGIADVIHMPKWKTYGIYTPRPKAGAKTAYEWELFGRPVTTAGAMSPKIDFGKDASDIRLMDVNGDGMVDAVYSSGTELQTFFSLGRYQGGFGQFGNGKWSTGTTATISVDPVAKCVPYAGTPVRWSDTEIKIADMNGDGLPDIVKLQKGKIEYWPGRGDGTWGTGDPGSCKPGTFSSGGSIVMNDSPWFTDPSAGALRVDDVNGDGLDDLVQIRFTDVDIWLNVDGQGWTARHVIAGTPASPSYLTRTRLVDINGSGTRDVLWGDGLNYRYIDLLGGKRPWVLTKVENGLGKTTELEYSTSTQLMLAAEAAKTPWTKKAPIVQHVVTKEIVRDNLGGTGRPAGVYVTQYTYSDPYFDGIQREFRGFETTRVTRLGDENSPTAHTQSTFLLGECTPATAYECTPQGAWKDEPREALKGLPVVSETFDDAGTYLQTEHHQYTLRTLYVGRDGRSVKHAFESASDTFLYDTTPFVGSTGDRRLADVLVDGASEPNCSATPIPTDCRAVPVRSLTGRVRIEGSTVVDVFGNALASTAKGCTEGCGPGGPDEEITTTSTPVRITSDPGGWMYRTAVSYVTGSKVTAQRHRKTVTYDRLGRPTTTSATLSGSLPLERFHAEGAAVALPPATKSVDGEIGLDETQYDVFGNVTFASGANGRCRTVTYDGPYADLATSETVYVGPSSSLSSGGKSFPCGNLGLTAEARYDRGLELVTEVKDIHKELSTVSYDGFGRVTEIHKPNPTDPLHATVQPSVKIEYLLGNPVSRMHTQVQDGATPEVASYREAWAIVDGLGRTIATLDEADKSAGDDAAWVVNGLTDYDAKGGARRAYLAWFYDGPPDKLPFTTPTTRYGRKRYDSFGRGVQTYGLDGQTTLYTAYHALSTDAWDAADLLPGPHQGTPASVRKDGHGRTIAVTERAHVGSALEEREIQTQYLPTGEVARITRTRPGKGTADTPVVRWMQYDSLGRMVLNVEPNTSTGFTPDPASFTGKAWRYAYNDAGDLVGTSDARGCGTNYSYDSAGRLLGEDYSPCLKHHPAYSAPVSTPGGETGFEVLNRYDYAPGDKAAITSAEPECTIDTSLYSGRLVEVLDRGARTVTVYNGRGRVKCAARQMAKPGVPDNALATRYATQWFVQYAKFDGADRPIEESTGAKVSSLLGGDEKSAVTTSYTGRGSVKSVGGSYGTLVSSVVHDADGLAQQIEYGDVAKTKTAFDYDDKRRLRSVQTYRGPPPWTGTTPLVATTFQQVLENLDYRYDNVDNPVEIRDWRNPADWPAGAKPVSRQIEYDDLYRVTKVGYQYSAGDDTWVSPFAAENAASSSGTALDPRLAKPSPHVSFDKRVLWQSFSYDWLGNTTQTDDDAKGFYDRSLGGIVNGTASAGPYQLKSASSPTGPRAGSLTAKYDAAGYLVSLAVQRNGPCLPAGATCGQRFVYDWDEVGRLQRARRWDLATVGVATDPEPPSTVLPAVELQYQYNAGDQRTLKTAIEPATGDQRHTVYVFASLELRRTAWTGTDYVRDSYSEVPYLFAHGVRVARVAYEDADVPNAAVLPTLLKPRLHVFLELGDHLGSTSTVVDLATSELVEKSTYLAYGQSESDYRPGRWKSFREDHRFTGKEEDAEVGLEYFGFRYLSSNLGRWLSPDPPAIHAGRGNPNVFAYVSGRLFAAIDLLGLDDFLVGFVHVWGTPDSLLLPGVLPPDGDLHHGGLTTRTVIGSSLGEKKGTPDPDDGIPKISPGFAKGAPAPLGSPKPKATAAKAGAAKASSDSATKPTTTKADAKKATKAAAKRPCKCFAAGTPIAVDGGWLAIEDIREGDLVWALDEAAQGQPELRPVEAVIVKTNESVTVAELEWETFAFDVDAEFGRLLAQRRLPESSPLGLIEADRPNGLGVSFQEERVGPAAEAFVFKRLKATVVATLDHPFRSRSGWQQLGDIATGGELWSPGSGKVRITTKGLPSSRTQVVYNLRVAGAHTFFVGAPWPVWVHNEDPCSGGFAPPSGASQEEAEYPKYTAIPGRNSGVDFSGTKFLYKTKGNEKNIVRIKYTGSRKKDFESANVAAHMDKKPADYTWHHLHDYDPVTGEGTMQLVESGAHQANQPHTGGVHMYEQHHKVKYKP